MSILEVKEGLRQQHPNDRVPYTVDTTDLISSPTSPAVEAFDESTGADVTTTVFPSNSPTASGNIITLSLLRALTAGHTYRIEVTFTVSTQIRVRYFRVECIST